MSEEWKRKEAFDIEMALDEPEYGSVEYHCRECKFDDVPADSFPCNICVQGWIWDRGNWQAKAEVEE